MNMKNQLAAFLLGGALLSLAACADKKPQLNISLSDKFEGQEVELINFLDSTQIATGTITDGKLTIDPATNGEVFTSVLIDGRTRAFYITQPGIAQVNDSSSSAFGTPLNDKFGVLLTTLDSIENLDDMPLYLDFVEKSYNENKDNPIGSYFGIEWLKYADLAQADSMLAVAPKALKDSPKARHYLNFAKLRAATAPGQPFVDFEGETADGKKVNFSQYIKPGTYTLVDFWASWCPYCIKELPEMTEFYSRWKDKGLEIVGVAVRDTPDDTKGAVKKHNISWPVVYNTQRTPYNIYGFSGIPHHILVGPDGKIISRDESISQIEKRLQSLQ